MRRSLAGALLALMLAAALICPAWGEDFRPLLENRPLTAGDSVSDWLAVASGRAGLQRPDYLRDLESYVTSMYRENGGLDRIKATEWHRITLAVLAQGGDPTAFGRDREGKPIDLVAEGTYNWSRSRSLGAQGLNGWIFALITLDSGGFAVPEGAAYTREDMRRAILSAQTEEGAFGLSAGTADVDITAMALQALDRLRAGQGRLYDLRDIPPTASASASPLPWLIAGAAGLAAAGIVIIVIRKRKRVCTK